MQTQIPVNVTEGQDALARLDDGVAVEGDEEKAELYEKWCQQEWDRFQDQQHQAEHREWLKTACRGCAGDTRATGPLCDGCWEESQ